MNKIVPFIPQYKREPGNHDFVYYGGPETDRKGNRFYVHRVRYLNKKNQPCVEVLRVEHLGK